MMMKVMGTGTSVPSHDTLKAAVPPELKLNDLTSKRVTYGCVCVCVFVAHVDVCVVGEVCENARI